MHAYADKTTVTVARSRGQIDDLLRDFGCDGIGWMEDQRHSTVALTFRWPSDAGDRMARMVINTGSTLDAESHLGGQRRYTYEEPPVTEVKKVVRQRQRSAHRLLFLKLKADLHAVRAGLISDYDAFLPYLIDASGKTVSEQLRRRFETGATRLIESQA